MALTTVLSLLHAPSSAMILLISFVLLFAASLALYRVWIHPLEAFPGPLAARTTFWYEFYYNYFHRGAYYLQIKEMHRRYGPIVRVTPDELHINSPLFWQHIFVTSAVRKTNNYLRSADGTGFEDMTAVSHLHDDHRLSREPLDPFFSKAGIKKVEQRVLERVEKLCHRFRELRGTGQVIHLFNAFSSLTADAVSSMIFEEPSDCIQDPDFNAGFFSGLKTGILSVSVLANLPTALTSPLLKYALEKATGWKVWDDRARRQIEESRLASGDEAKTRDNTTVFDQLVHSDLVEEHFGNGGFARLAQLLQQAGTYNVAHTLCTIITYLLLDQNRLEKLRDELRKTYAENKCPTWRDLEKIPYLKATINEGLRMAIGAMNRSARISPDVDILFNGWKIPKGTPVSMTSYWMHNDPEVFPEPNEFRPERWLCAPETLKVMCKYFVPFSKGSRGCLAQEFVYMLLYLTLAELFRPGAPEFALYQTDKSDVVPVHGYLFPLPQLKSKGVRATLH